MVALGLIYMATLERKGSDVPKQKRSRRGSILNKKPSLPKPTKSKKIAKSVELSDPFDFEHTYWIKKLPKSG